MPYVSCPVCGLPGYAAPRHMVEETCARCGAPLRPPAARGPDVARDFAPDTTAPALARVALRGFADRLAPLDMETVELLATEMMANAVRHANLDGGRPIALRVFLYRDRIRVQVHDHGPGFAPEVHAPDAGSDSGRGLFLIDRLASEWGVIGGDDGTTVWFEIALEPA